MYPNPMLRLAQMFGTALRETGQAVDRLGLRFVDNEIFRETFSRHRNIMNLWDQTPMLGRGAWVAPNASVVGSVLVGNETSVWYGAVVRGDKNVVRIGSRVNIQDRAVLSTVPMLQDVPDYLPRLDIKNSVTIGHGAVLTSCEVNNLCLIGQGSIVQEGAKIGFGSVIAAGSVVLPGTIVPDMELWAGNPAKYVRDISADELKIHMQLSDNYVELKQQHEREFLPFGTAYWRAEEQNLLEVRRQDDPEVQNLVKELELELQAIRSKSAEELSKEIRERKAKRVAEEAAKQHAADVAREDAAKAKHAKH